MQYDKRQYLKDIGGKKNWSWKLETLDHPILDKPHFAEVVDKDMEEFRKSGSVNTN